MDESIWETIHTQSQEQVQCWIGSKAAELLQQQWQEGDVRLRWRRCAKRFRLLVIIRPPLEWIYAKRLRPWRTSEVAGFYNISLAEASSWIERVYHHGTKGLSPLLKVLEDGSDDPASPSKPSQMRLRLHTGLPPTTSTSTASRQLFAAHSSSS